MLKTRVITAVVLLAVFLSALFFLPTLGWAWFAALVAAVAGWEWGGLLRMSPRGRVVCGAIVFALCVSVILLAPSALGDIKPPVADGGAFMAWWFHGLHEMWLFGRWFYFPAAVFWCILVPLWLWRHWRLPTGRWIGIGFLFGLLLILPTWLALVQVRNAGGPWTLLVVMAIVWVADTSAYFFGRAFGRRKLAPSISPGKTWAGAWGAVAGVLIYGFAIMAADKDGRGVFFVNPVEGILPFALILICLTVLSIVGDLFESLLKRQAEIKDSSAILPGHGGVLDRIDSLTSTLPIVALFFLGAALPSPG